MKISTKVMGFLTATFVAGVVALGGLVIYNVEQTGTAFASTTSTHSVAQVAAIPEDGHDCKEVYSKMKAQYPDFPIGCPDVDAWLKSKGYAPEDAYPSEITPAAPVPVVEEPVEVVVPEPVVEVQPVVSAHTPTQSAQISHTEVTDTVCLTVRADTSAAVEAAASAWMENPLTAQVTVVDSATHSDAVEATICAEMVLNLDAEVNVSAEVVSN